MTGKINNIYCNDEGVFAVLDSVDFDGNTGGFIVIEGNIYYVEGVAIAAQDNGPEQTTLKLKYSGPYQPVIDILPQYEAEFYCEAY